MTNQLESKAFWGSDSDLINEWIAATEKKALLKRLWEKDASIWTSNISGQKEIKNRLGWLEAPSKIKEKIAEIVAFSDEIKAAGFSHIVLLGMGGSSLAPEVFGAICGEKEGSAKLLILDSTDPAKVKSLEEKINLEKTLFIVSSKSGGTIELLSFFKYFWAKLDAINPEKAGEHFIAITDPQTPLVSMAHTHHFRRVFLASPDVGGRFSALTYFGLIPASLIGVDIIPIIENAQKMSNLCSNHELGATNAAMNLGVGMAVLAESGRDKLTIVGSKSLESFGDWAEQLVAESTGKEEVGIVPIVREKIQSPSYYSDDRFFVALIDKKDPKIAELETKLNALESAGHPVLRFVWSGWEVLGAEFYRWEMATAIACALLKVNAFDQPDVQSAKDSAKKLLQKIQAGGSLEIKTVGHDIEAFFENVENGNYVAILAFLPDSDAIKEKLLDLRSKISKQTKLATTVGFGPRYLHSTGQLHKGGANNGVFLLITTEHTENLPIAGEKYSFADLELAQSMGDFDALETKGRWLYHLRLKNISELDSACELILKALQVQKA